MTFRTNHHGDAAYRSQKPARGTIIKTYRHETAVTDTNRT